jgi:hypothetical protein
MKIVLVILVVALLFDVVAPSGIQPDIWTLRSLNPLGEKGIKLANREWAHGILTTALEGPDPESGWLLWEQSVREQQYNAKQQHRCRNIYILRQMISICNIIEQGIACSNITQCNWKYAGVHKQLDMRPITQHAPTMHLQAHAKKKVCFTIFWHTQAVKACYSGKLAWTTHAGKWHKLISHAYMRQEQSYMNDISDPKNNSMHIMHQCVCYKLV